MAALITGFAFVCPLNAVAADRGSPRAYDQSDATPGSRKVPGQHVEGHIAFLHAELKITPTQEQLWAAVADAMREDVKEMQDGERQVSRQTQGSETAIQYLKNRAMFANLRAQGEARFLAALQPLYEDFSMQQKQTADELLISRGIDQ
jgi:hypothetical protein